jgi:hypothetical protein
MDAAQKYGMSMETVFWISPQALQLRLPVTAIPK